MVMRGGGRNREIRALQEKMAGNQGGYARQQERMNYLQKQQGSVGNPERQAQRDNYLIKQSQRQPQTGGPLERAMGPGGQEAMRTQQPYQGGRMSNGGVTMDGPVRSMDGSPVTTQPGQGGSYGDFKAAYGAANDAMQGQPKDNFRNFGNQADLDAYRAQRGELRMQPGQLEDAARQVQQGFNPMQRPTPGNMPGQAPSMPPGFTTYPMQMSQEDLVKRYPPGTQPPGLQQFGPGAAVGKDPSVYAGNRGPDYFRGQGMDMGKFNQPGYQAPQRQVQGNQIAGGGTTMDRFSRPGYTAPQRNVAGDQIRGGGSPGLSRRRVNTDPNRRGQPAGVLAPIPR